MAAEHRDRTPVEGCDGFPSGRKQGRKNENSAADRPRKDSTNWSSLDPFAQMDYAFT